MTYDGKPLTVDQVADLLDCGADTVVERIVAGDLPGLKFGRGWIIPAEALHARLNALALQEADRRRQQRTAPAKPSQMPVRPVQRGRSARVARTPPALPVHP